MTGYLHDDTDEECHKCGRELEEVISYYCTGCRLDADECECSRDKEAPWDEDD